MFWHQRPCWLWGPAPPRVSQFLEVVSNSQEKPLQMQTNQSKASFPSPPLLALIFWAAILCPQQPRASCTRQPGTVLCPRVGWNYSNQAIFSLTGPPHGKHNKGSSFPRKALVHSFCLSLCLLSGLVLLHVALHGVEFPLLSGSRSMTNCLLSGSRSLTC